MAKQTVSLNVAKAELEISGIDPLALCLPSYGPVEIDIENLSGLDANNVTLELYCADAAENPICFLGSQNFNLAANQTTVLFINPSNTTCGTCDHVLAYIENTNNCVCDSVAIFVGWKGKFPKFQVYQSAQFANALAESVDLEHRVQEAGVQVIDGELELVIEAAPVPPGWSENHQKLKPGYDYYCGELRTNPALRVRYGRIETRMQIGLGNRCFHGHVMRIRFDICNQKTHDRKEMHIEALTIRLVRHGWAP